MLKTFRIISALIRHLSRSIWNIYKPACYDALYAYCLIYYDFHHERRRKTERKESK